MKINTKLLMTLSGWLMFMAGIGFSFFPAEILKYAGENPSTFTTLILQLAGALYFGFGMLNRMVRNQIIGGIYGRPVAIGNFLHFLVVGIALLKSTSAFNNSPYIWTVAIIYAGFAIAFGLVTFTHPAAVKASV